MSVQILYQNDTLDELISSNRIEEILCSDGWAPYLQPLREDGDVDMKALKDVDVQGSIGPP
jgi:hypothetical protein